MFLLKCQDCNHDFFNDSLDYSKRCPWCACSRYEVKGKDEIDREIEELRRESFGD